MNIQEQLELATNIATSAHTGQFRNDGTTPYIEHPKAVADFLTNKTEKIVAMLHDVIEDTHHTKDSLLNLGISPIIIRAISLLTKEKNEEYIKYILRIKKDSLARPVKIADIICNLTDAPSNRQKEKYKKALRILLTDTI